MDRWISGRYVLVVLATVIALSVATSGPAQSHPEYIQFSPAAVDFEANALDIKSGIELLRQQPGITTLVLRVDRGAILRWR